MAIFVPIWLLPFCFYFGFVGSISIYRAWLRRDLHPITLASLFPFLLAFWILDLAINWTLLWLVMGRSPAHCYTISDRFAEYDARDTGWRGRFARWFCNEFLNVFDKGHC